MSEPFSDGHPRTIVPSPDPAANDRPWSYQDIFEAFAFGHIRPQVFARYARSHPHFEAWLRAKAKAVRKRAMEGWE